ncbi:acetylcholinesterase collagenic tail peptide-like isoform X1 [Mastacembelus armatus]|uniref:acetylcholinesterase collagenic tail peptide-like isoform X1 n=1 Tax=Mastacembelus armatus TaxID=205130 RepID=UPI000E4619D4|nr:acetylcholinesterase collagenic tail peptide-like isoform X1 [Mastacembelus armatus]
MVTRKRSSFYRLVHCTTRASTQCWEEETLRSRGDADSAGPGMHCLAQQPPAGSSLSHPQQSTDLTLNYSDVSVTPQVDITDHITGPKGEKGCRGPRGPKGEPGAIGPEGDPGPQGSMGKPGQKGDKGDRGWRGLYGDVGTPGVIKGNTGRKGFRGEKGLKGNGGAKGKWGEHGVPGVPGEKGDPGQWGAAGQMGERGSRGEPGGRGPMGLKGFRGPPGKLGHLGPMGLPGLTGEPGLPGQVYILPGLQGDTGGPGPPAKCSCSQVQPSEQMLYRVPTIFVADGEKQMRRLQGENVMVLRTDRKALFIYTDSQWINVLVTTAGDTITYTFKCHVIRTLNTEQDPSSDLIQWS